MTKHIKAAAEAHSNLNTFCGIAALLEGGTIYGDNKAKDRIIAICMKEQQRQLAKYDAAVAAAQSRRPTPKDAA